MEDDLFQSLGGSLMKDLLADLQGDDGEGDGWLSLEQLEKELSQLDDNSAPPATAAPALGSLPLPPVPTAASMVVSGQQQQQQQQPIQGVGLLGAVTVTKAPADAWKESLQKFTASSLDQDFLAADAVRKQQKSRLPAPAPQLPPGFMAEAEEYDATEKVTLKAPPGLASGGPPPGMKVADEDKEREEKALLAAAALVTAGKVAPSVPQGQPFPKTPSNSVVATPGGNQKKGKSTMPKTPRNSVIVASKEEAKKQATKVMTAVEDDIPMMGKVSILQKEGKDKAEPIPSTQTPRNSVAAPSQEAAAAQGMGMPRGMPPQMMPGMPPQGMPPQMIPGMPLHGMPGMPPHGMPMHGMPPQGMMPGMPPQGMPMPGMPPQGMPPQGMPPHMMVPPGGAVPVAMAARGPAWQTGPRPPPPAAPMRVFCNPHPNAPPIPAQVLESRMMKSRDITYIVHSMMKPVLMAGFSEHDYDIQLLHRQSGGRPAGPRPLMMRRGKKQQQGDEPIDIVQQQMASREKKSKDWSTKNAALGHVAKANIARPRALIASPALSQANQEKAESASEQKQRARLWKARIYCDQAYQAYLAVVDIWAKATPGSVPPGVHGPLIRMMKCLGIAPVASSAAGESDAPSSPGGGDFQVDASVLQLFLKLSKGRILFARIVEQALLPPSAVQAVLPATLEVLYKTPQPSKENKQGGASAYGGDITDDRCFRALTVVVQTLPALSGESILKCAEMMKANSEAALSSTCRMECLHALLQRGTGLAGTNDPSLADYPAKWKEQENNFMAILSGM